MTQTLTRPENDTEAEPTAPPRRRIVELSFVQLFAGALAAMTSALIGSRLGVSGTVIGAAVGSLVAGVTGSVYTASLQRGHQVIAPIALKAVPPSSRKSPTAVLPAAAAVPPGVPSRALLEAGAAAPARRPLWKPVLATAAVMFVLAGLGITTIELFTGQSLSGREGTTISQVSTGAEAQAEPPAPPQPAEVPTEEPTEVPTEETPADPGPSPSETPSEVPTEEGEPTDQPSESPSEIPTEEPSETPSEDTGEAPTEEPSAPSTPEEPAEQVQPE